MSIDLSGLSAKELASLISQAQKRQTVISKRTPITKVRARILKFAKAEGYTIEELFGGGSAAPIRGKAAKKAPTAGRKLGKVAPKYRNPANSKETWTGRGKQPRWLAALVASGKKVEDFLIKSGKK
ncbi:H-NS histone family protein [Pseudoxanthomonas winnipegensis]|uniref:H-NS histone family protein n=1 Tax=Pseudoxanthomonas winnipegensis TaxID=2480810 RepID=A0A4Q8LH08_9GAMM|nr:H-NS histone family protein [Pseudoxanthomonas winnipegensis]